jgi:hypothetical protein
VVDNSINYSCRGVPFSVKLRLAVDEGKVVVLASRVEGAGVMAEEKARESNLNTQLDIVLYELIN